ncbi:hypothetical protein EFO70_13335, partial [Lacticaseibacillus rhamnosus]|nr:hypothetical protein [Lacticaseibacillus rhamnosus]
FEARPWSKAEKPTPLKTNFTTEPATAPPALAFYFLWFYDLVYQLIERNFILTDFLEGRIYHLGSLQLAAITSPAVTNPLFQRKMNAFWRWNTLQ